jgi:hypothetical protein
VGPLGVGPFGTRDTGVPVDVIDRRGRICMVIDLEVARSGGRSGIPAGRAGASFTFKFDGGCGRRSGGYRYNAVTDGDDAHPAESVRILVESRRISGQMSWIAIDY